MEQFLAILSKPDNIPIVGMLVAVFFCLWWSFKQALKNDRFIHQGQPDRIYEEMID
jgi:uncharacterized membrane protein YwzB